MTPDRHRRSAGKAATAAFMVAALALGWMLGNWSASVTHSDLQTGRRQSYDRGQCTVDILLLPYDPPDRLGALGGDPHLPEVCRAAQRIVRPHDPAPDVGESP